MAGTTARPSAGGRNWRSGVMALGALGPQQPASSSYKQQQQSQDGEGDRVSHGWFHGRRRHTHTRGAQSTAVDQSTGGGANARYARLLDPSHASHKVLCYRLVSLPDPSNPWGDGLLLEAARTHASDAALDAALHELLLRNWEDDPLRVEDAAPHRRLTVDTRDSRRRHVDVNPDFAFALPNGPFGAWKMTRIPELYGWLSNGTALYDETHGHTASTLEVGDPPWRKPHAPVSSCLHDLTPRVPVAAPRDHYIPFVARALRRAADESVDRDDEQHIQHCACRGRAEVAAPIPRSRPLPGGHTVDLLALSLLLAR